MPYLNWKDLTRIRQEVGPLDASAGNPGAGSGDKLRFSLSFGAGELRTLLPMLRESFAEGASGGAELRLDLPRGWIVFWKRRDGDSRLLLAHPQAEEWVATVALSAEHGAILCERLAAMAPGESLHVGELSPSGLLGGMVNNLEMTLVHL